MASANRFAAIRVAVQLSIFSAATLPFVIIKTSGPELRHPLSMPGFQSHLRRWLSTLIGLAICTVSAAAASKVFAHTAWRGFVPWIFVIVLVVLASIYGTAVGVLGSVLSALIFAYWLYAPAGSVQIANPAARNGLAWMIVGGVALSYLLAPGFRHPDGPGRK